MVIGRKGQHTDEPAKHFVGGPRRKKRAMAAIMLKREEAGEQGARGNGEQESEPVGVRRHQEHDGDKSEKWNSGGDQLKDRFPAIGLAVEIAMGGQPLCLQAELRRKLRLALNIQVVPQYEFVSPDSPCTCFAGLRL